MNKVLNTNDIRQVAFVDSLHKALKENTYNAIKDHNKIIAKASLYLNDGVTDEECVELLVIDGIPREAASGYVEKAHDENYEDIKPEYSFQFEDVYGKTWSSHDINKTVFASNDEEAWGKSEKVIFSLPSIEPDKIISVDRI